MMEWQMYLFVGVFFFIFGLCTAYISRIVHVLSMVEYDLLAMRQHMRRGLQLQERHLTLLEKEKSYEVIEGESVEAVPLVDG
jgi:hypothetical protein